MVSKTARGGRLHMPQAGAQIAVAMTIGVLQPPVVWIAGREPPPPPIVPPRPAPAGSAGCTVPGSFGLRASLWTAQTAQKCSYVRRVNRINSCYRAGLFALRGEKGCGESMTHRLCSWTSVRCCEPPMKSKRRSERNSCQCHCVHSARASTPLWAACMTPSLRAGKKGGPQGMCEGTLRTQSYMGQIVLVGNFRRRLARELLVLRSLKDILKQPSCFVAMAASSFWSFIISLNSYRGLGCSPFRRFNGSRWLASSLVNQILEGSNCTEIGAFDV